MKLLINGKFFKQQVLNSQIYCFKSTFYMSNITKKSLPTIFINSRMGDLVTTKHWGNEFLHESFADYFSVRLMQHSEDDKDFVVKL